MSVCEEKGHEDEASNSPKTRLKCIKCIFRVGDKGSYLQHLKRGSWGTTLFWDMELLQIGDLDCLQNHCQRCWKNGFNMIL